MQYFTLFLILPYFTLFHKSLIKSQEGKLSQTFNLMRNNYSDNKYLVFLNELDFKIKV